MGDVPILEIGNLIQFADNTLVLSPSFHHDEPTGQQHLEIFCRIFQSLQKQRVNIYHCHENARSLTLKIGGIAVSTWVTSKG